MEGDILRFGRFCVVPGARQLYCEGSPVDIGSRAFDLLTALVRKRGQILTKEEIVSHVWPTTFVGECNLRCQVSTLRKILGEDGDAIKTIVGRGYMLAVEAVSNFENSTQSSGTPTATVGSEPGAEVDEPTIALIGDDGHIREAIHELLKSAGMRVESFASVQSFQEAFRNYPPACLVWDVWPPGRNGRDFRAELVKAPERFPVVFSSGHADIPMTVMAMKAGAFEFLTKPVLHVTLLDVIREISVSGPRPRGATESGSSANHPWRPAGQAVLPPEKMSR